MIKRIFLTSLFLFYFYSAFCQITQTGRNHINVLASKAYYGRGYVNKGLEKSARYIRKELKKSNVEAGIDNYFQLTPKFPVNTFPKAIILKELSNKNKEDINTHVAGKSFLLHPSSGSIHLNQQKIIRINSDQKIPALKSNTIYFVEKSDYPQDSLELFQRSLLNSELVKNSLLIIYDPVKLTWSPSMEKSNNAVLTTNKIISTEMIQAQWENTWKASFQGINVIGKVKGKRSDSSVYFTAHYDHLGMLGKHMFPGANDNASGTALLLELASYYAQNQPNFDTYFLFTCGEELGLLGSYFYLQDPASDLSKIKILINLDMVGTGNEGITVVNAIKHQDFYDKMKKYNQDRIIEIKQRGEACNSDHCLFDKAGIPAVFIYTLGGKQAYHDINDDGTDLSLAAFNSLFDLLIEVV
ncbi:MAG: M28 family metallopeptidase, partial [Nitrososphaeraceae archaeon]|nr:M28 family metallopeptidase [Nitrososphaeraceae archaeon]